ncbi:MAG: hypothetical protein KJN69_09140 [Gammaproteobacteria bacterium]|nr:hypothetical protein [Gammaproteobacteria bacterium]
MKRSLAIVFSGLLLFLGQAAALAQEDDWPRTVPLEQGTVTIYPPQVDERSGDVIKFRAALAYRKTAGSEPVFGAGWFESRVEIDPSRGIVHPLDFKVTETRFPAGTDDLQSGLSSALARQSANWNLDFSLNDLEAGLEKAKAESLAQQGLNTAPPKIIYRDRPALLISMDGDPVLREIEDSPYRAVINTPYPLIYNGDDYFLNVAKDTWYRSSKATGPYRFEDRPPSDIAAMVNPEEAGEASESFDEPVTAANAPEIIVSTEPAELVVTEGPAAFVPLVDDLLVLQNSDDDVFMHVSSQEYFIVLAGRWYRAGSLNGPWAYQPADRLPAAFADIPRGSDQADSRVYVAGTDEAKDAVLDSYVPQTAAVNRGEVDVDVVYDGDPVYRPVDGTDLVYIENTGSTVLLADGLYYLVEDGVWYVSASPNGPWQVATRRPTQIDTILPTSPVHNVKYVQIYDYTPNVVYVGYTPGYTGSYVYHNTIVYGSGWHYRPWVSPYYYYPRHSTWGFNVSYNPWSGWNFGLSWGWGPFSFSYYTGGYWHRSHHWHHRHFGRWGPHGYRPRHYARRGYGHGRYAGRHHSPGPHQRHDNLYRDSAQRARVAETRDVRTRATRNRDQNAIVRNKEGRSRITPVNRSELRTKANVQDANFRARKGELYADNSGNVYRRATRGPVPKDSIGRKISPVKKVPVSRSTRPVQRETLKRSAAPVPKDTINNRRNPVPKDRVGRSVNPVRNDAARPDIGAPKAAKSRTTPSPPKARNRLDGQSRAPAQKQIQAPQQRQIQAPQQRQIKAPQQRQSKAPQQRQIQAPARSQKGGGPRVEPVKRAPKSNSKAGGRKRD